MSWVEEVLAALAIDVVRAERHRVWALCPYHQKRDDPKGWATTFFVRLEGKRRDEEGRQYEAIGQHFCFACGHGGSMRKLVMDVRGCDEEAAKEFIKKRGGARGSKVEEVKKKVVVARVQPKLGRMRFVMPREVIFDPLAKWVGPAREYAEGRGIPQGEGGSFGIGYAVDGTKLSGRIILPWRGPGGIVAGYSARTFVGEEPKYTTPGPTENADRTVMFGEHLWPSPKARRVVAVIEGALNGLACRRVRPDIPIAALGGSKVKGEETYIDLAKKLATFPIVLLLTDHDEAGDDAARDIAMMVGRYSVCSRGNFPKGQDALDVGPARLLSILERALRRAA